MFPNLTLTHSGSYVHTEDKGEPYLGHSPRLSITDSEGELLMGLVANKSVLEIGTGLGVSASYMAQTAVSVTTVDIDEWVRDNIVLPPNVTLVIEPPLIDGNLKFDVVFIDGSHIVSHIVSDIERAMGHLVEGGIIILHDNGYDKIKDAVKQSNLKLVEEFDTTHGIGVYTLYGENE